MLRFRLIEVVGSIYRYAYSRGKGEFDGIVSINSQTEAVTVEKPCTGDEDDFSINNVIEMTGDIMQSGYPAKRTVMFY